MAKFMKKTFAMMLVLCMLVSMLPLQALAEETDLSALEGLDVSMTIDEETNTVVVEFAPAAEESASEEETAPAAEETASEEEAAPAEETASEEETAPAAEETASEEEAAPAAEETASEEEVAPDAEETVSEDAVIIETPTGDLEWESELTFGENIDAEVTDVTVTEEVTEEGAIIVTESATVETEGTLENGAEIEGEETYTETTTSTENNTRVESVVEGEETITEEQEGEINAEIEVPMTDVDDPETEIIENQNTVLGDEVGTVIETEGEKPENLGEGEYDYSETVVVEQGSVTITTENIEFSEEVAETTEMEHVVSTTTPTEDNDLVYSYEAPEMYLPGYEGEVEAPEGSKDDGYTFTYVGAGNTSKFMPAIVYKEPLDEQGKLDMYGENAYLKKAGKTVTNYYISWLKDEVKDSIAKDENGEYVTDAEGYILDVNGNRIFKEERTSVDPEGNTVYLHRFDNYNSSMYTEGWYEDGEWQAELNGEESFAAIWAAPQQFILVDDAGNVVTTYCADVSTPTQDNFGYNVENLEDADYYSEEEAAHIRAIASNGYWGDDGNLEEMRAKLAEAGFTAEELASLNDGVALTATQMAIWTYSNKMSSIQFVNSYYSNWGVGNLPAEKEDEVKVLFKLYDYLTSLEPEEVEGTTADTIITKDNFVENVNVTVIEKAEDHENNKDDDDTNDAYKTTLTFALVVTPSTENGDDLVVQVIGSNGELIASGRIVGELKEGEVWAKNYGNNNYGLENITMIEGDQTFSLNLKGVQHLKEGVYLYSSEVVNGESSQTLVGVASGNRSVNVSMDITFNLDVKDQVVATERVWRKVNDPVDTPEPPVRYRMERGVGEEEVIIDEPVPLADVPQTGDNSVLWFALIMLSGLGLCILNLSGKKCKA